MNLNHHVPVPLGKWFFPLADVRKYRKLVHRAQSVQQRLELNWGYSSDSYEFYCVAQLKPKNVLDLLIGT